MRTNTTRLAGRFEEDRYSRVRSINKTADAPMHALTTALPRAMRRIRPLPCGTKLNSRKRHIGFYELGNDSRRATARP